MNTKDILTLVLGALGFGLGCWNAWVNFKKERREKEKAEQDNRNKEYEHDISILKTTLRGYENFVRTFVAMLQEGKEKNTHPNELYKESRTIHLATIDYQNWKFDYMKNSLKNRNNKEIENFLDEIEKIRESLFKERSEFKKQSQIQDEYIKTFQNIQSKINSLTNRYIAQY